MREIIEITDVSDDRVRAYSRLTEAQLRNRLEPEKGLFIAESPKVIRSALDAGCEPQSLLMERRHLELDGRAILERTDCPVYTGAREVLKSLTGYELTRGVLCAMRRPPERSAAEISEGARRAAVIDSVVDSTNVGAIFRSAAALGMDAVFLTRTTCDPLNRRAVRVSMGTVFMVPWAYIGSPAELKQYGFSTCAMALTDESVSISDPSLRECGKLAIVLGTEGDGLSSGVIAGCDFTVKIPMYHGVDSLNVAAASAVAFWELHK